MRIEAGTTSPAKLVTNNDEVIAEGTYTHCGRILDSIASDFETGQVSELRHTVKERDQRLSDVWSLMGTDNHTECMAKLRKLCQQDLIPMNVYYHEENANFYDHTGKGMGDAFFNTWDNRRTEFPKWEPTMQGAKDRARAALAKISPFAGPSTSCDARPSK